MTRKQLFFLPGNPMTWSQVPWFYRWLSITTAGVYSATAMGLAAWITWGSVVAGWIVLVASFLAGVSCLICILAFVRGLHNPPTGLAEDAPRNGYALTPIGINGVIRGGVFVALLFWSLNLFLGA